MLPNSWNAPLTKTKFDEFVRAGVAPYIWLNFQGKNYKRAWARGQLLLTKVLDGVHETNEEAFKRVDDVTRAFLPYIQRETPVQSDLMSCLVALSIKTCKKMETCLRNAEKELVLRYEKRFLDFVKVVHGKFAKHNKDLSSICKRVLKDKL